MLTRPELRLGEAQFQGFQAQFSLLRDGRSEWGWDICDNGRYSRNAGATAGAKCRTNGFVQVEPRFV